MYTLYNIQLITTAATPTNPAVSNELEVLAAAEGLLVVAAAALSVKLTTPLVAPVAVTFFVAVPFADTSAIVAMVIFGFAAHLSTARIFAEALKVISAHCLKQVSQLFFFF